MAEQEAYIHKMKRYIHSIFTSLHIPEADASRYEAQLKELGRVALQLDIELMADVSPASLDALGLTWHRADELLNWGVTGLRMDYGIDEETVASLSHRMKIALNASTLTKESLQRLKEFGLYIGNIEAWHNFYPRPETGLGWTYFVERNEWLKKEGLSVAAFIPGDEKPRGPLYEGLPTLESHRGQSPFAAYMEMKRRGGVDKVLVGDVSISDASLEQFAAYEEDVILLRAKADSSVDTDILKKVATVHTNRADCARDCIRSVESRQYASMGKGGIRPHHCARRPAGTITIDNETYMRYQGEVQITVNDLPADDRVNVLGRVIPEDQPLLRWIKGNQKFRIQWT